MVYAPYNNYKGDCMVDFKLIAYEKENGEVPVEEFLDSVNPVSYTHLTLPTN